jgi:hypothetical protein
MLLRHEMNARRVAFSISTPGWLNALVVLSSQASGMAVLVYFSELRGSVAYALPIATYGVVTVTAYFIWRYGWSLTVVGGSIWCRIGGALPLAHRKVEVPTADVHCIAIRAVSPSSAIRSARLILRNEAEVYLGHIPPGRIADLKRFSERFNLPLETQDSS